MKWNRQVRSFLDACRRAAFQRRRSAPMRLGVAVLDWRRRRSARPSLAAFAPTSMKHIVSLDMLGSEVARHYVPARPHVPFAAWRSCAIRAQAAADPPAGRWSSGRDERRLQVDGASRDRLPLPQTCQPADGRRIASERLRSDQPLDASFVARHNFSPRPESVEALQAGLSGDSYGKGSTAEQGEASALMEAIERYCGIFQGDEIRVTRRFTDFAEGEAINPKRFFITATRNIRKAPAVLFRRRRAAPFRSRRGAGMVAGMVAARRAIQICPDRPPVFLSRGRLCERL